MPSPRSSAVAPPAKDKLLHRQVGEAVFGQEDLEFLDQEAENLKLEDSYQALMSWWSLPPRDCLGLLEKKLDQNVGLSLRQINWSRPESLSQRDLNLIGLEVLNVVRELSPDPNRE